MDERWTLSVTAAAKVLGIGRSLAYEMIRTGELPHIRFGRRIVIPVKALEEMCNHGKTSRDKAEH